MKPLSDLGEKDCRYPVRSRGRKHLFCGKPSCHWNRPYCVDHYRVVWVKVETKNGRN